MSLLSLLADILFVGHSLVGPNLPPAVEATLRAMHEPTGTVSVQAQVINGSPLGYNWENGATAEGVNAREVLAKGTTDVLILTEAQPLASHLQWSATAENAARYAALAVGANPAARVYLYETWPSLNSGTATPPPDDPAGTVPWRTRITADLILWEDTAVQASASTTVGLIPAGQAMGLLSDAIDAGQVEGLMSIRDLFLDDIHLNGKGNYFVALVHAAAITGRSPEGLPTQLQRPWPTRDSVVSDALAATMQRIAWVAVTAQVARSPSLPARTDQAAVSATAPPAPTPTEPTAIVNATASKANATTVPSAKAATIFPLTPDATSPDTPSGALTIPSSTDTTDPANSPSGTLTIPSSTDTSEPATSPSAAPAPPRAPDATVVLNAATDTTTTALPATAAAQFPAVTNPNLALGLAGVNDWSPQLPFLNLMKTARPWIGHLPGQWGGWDHDRLAASGYLDAHGWPTAIPPELTGITTLILTDLAPDAGGAAGRYDLTWQGTGTLIVEGRATNLESTPNRIAFDFTPGDGAVLITLTATSPTGPVRNITVVRQDRAAALASGEIFNPDWLARIRGVKLLRFMDWSATNDSTVSTPDQRPRPDDYTWARTGVPLEIQIALANTLRADPWFNLPHRATDALIADYATLAHRTLDPALNAHVELSNEVWNWQFSQAQWAEDQAVARWGQKDTWVQFYALRAMQAAAIWTGIYGPDAPTRLTRIIGTQTGWLGLEDMILNAPLVIAEGLPAPATQFDAYAVTGYISAILGAPEKLPMVRDWLARSAATPGSRPYDTAITLAAQELRDGSVSGNPTDTLTTGLTEILPYHAAVAARHGLDLMMYEGGTHVVGTGPAIDDPALTDFFTALNYSSEMGLLYADLLKGWAQISPHPFNAFVDVVRPVKWGSWGALRHLTDDNPRWHALATGCSPEC